MEHLKINQLMAGLKSMFPLSPHLLALHKWLVSPSFNFLHWNDECAVRNTNEDNFTHRNSLLQESRKKFLNWLKNKQKNTNPQNKKWIKNVHNAITFIWKDKYVFKNLWCWALRMRGGSWGRQRLSGHKDALHKYKGSWHTWMPSKFMYEYDQCIHSANAQWQAPGARLCMPYRSAILVF